MYALVRFVTDDDNRRKHVVPVGDIYSFNPQDVSDFDRKATYKCFWVDPVDGINTGDYVIQILLLAETEEQLTEKATRKRIPMPRVNESDLESTDDGASAAQKEKDKQDRKKKKVNNSLAKKRQFESILNQHMVEAKKSTQLPPKATRPKGVRQAPSETSDSDDELIPASQADMAVKLSKKDANFWRMRYQRCEDEKKLLHERVVYLEKKLDEKIFALQPVLERIADYGLGNSNRSVVELHAPATLAMELPDNTDVAPPQLEAPQQSETVPLPLAHSLQEAGLPLDFTYADDGRFHLKGGTYIAEHQIRKIRLCNKPRIVVKDAGVSIWGSETLMQRSISGAVGPTRRAAGDIARRQLTPEKVEIVSATLQFWGQEKGVAVSHLIPLVPNILGEKIQDLRRDLKKRL